MFSWSFFLCVCVHFLGIWMDSGGLGTKLYMLSSFVLFFFCIHKQALQCCDFTFHSFCFNSFQRSPSTSFLQPVLKQVGVGYFWPWVLVDIYFTNIFGHVYCWHLEWQCSSKVPLNYICVLFRYRVGYSRWYGTSWGWIQGQYV